MKKIVLTMVVLALALISCNREESHITAPHDPQHPQAGVIVGFDTEAVTNKQFTDTHLYGFDEAQRMVFHNYYPTQQELSSDLFSLDGGVCTFVAVLNTGEGFTPVPASAPRLQAEDLMSELTLSQLVGYLKRSEKEYPNMLTGMLTREIPNNELTRVDIALADKSSGIISTTVTFQITLPAGGFVDYQSLRKRSASPYNLRGVVGFYQKEKNDPVNRVPAILNLTTEPGVYTFDVEMPQGNYDALLWVDYTESGSTRDLWYNTGDLKAIQLLSTDKTYPTGDSTHEVFYGATSVDASSEATTVNLAAERPQAKYQLVADDVKRYRELMLANPEKYVPLNQLLIKVLYEGYLPDGFNVKEGLPNSAQTGYKFQNPLPAIGAEQTEVTVGSDYILVNGTESSVVVTVLVTDQAGRMISRVQGVEVKYKRSRVTTLRGDFLTAGVVNPGIEIDTDWDGTHEVEF